MKIIRSVEEMQDYSLKLKQDKKTIALVDTEGELHQGHMSLVKVAKQNADIVILNILHTISYFNYNKERYEQGLKRYEEKFLPQEIELCHKNKVDILFLPLMEEIYSSSVKLDISIPFIDKFIQDRFDFLYINEKFIWVAKRLFDIIKNDVSVLGQKDIHMASGIKYLFKHCNLPTKIIIAPTARDEEGLAYSSRNRLLDLEERKRASLVFKLLQEIAVNKPFTHLQELKKIFYNKIAQAQGRLLYIDMYSTETMEKLKVVNEEAVLIIVAQFGEITLWDNVILKSRSNINVALH
jgi:pantoate--beta-alanine ligase|tara:strand:+ start:335 stop:1219 length:885 start_codon:yes stop_codon:yes gene_type:complete